MPRLKRNVLDLHVGRKDQGICRIFRHPKTERSACPGRARRRRVHVDLAVGSTRQEEMSHYALEMSVTGKPSPFTTFYYPPKMFSDAQTTLDVLVTLEDAFIAAYLVGVRDFSTPALRVLCGARSWASRATTAARARPGRRRVGPGRRTDQEDHRRPGQGRARRSAQQQRVRAHAQVDEDQPGGRGSDSVRRPGGRGQAGFDTTKPYQFRPFTPTLPNPLGAFHSFAG